MMATIGSMSGTKKKTGRPPGRKPVYNAHVRLKPTLGAALDRYVDGIKPATTQRAVIELALEEYLSKHGHWPVEEE